MRKRMVMMTVIAVLALGLSALAQDKPAAPDKPAPAVQARPMERMKDALQLTPEQEAKLEAHRKAVTEQRKAFAEQMKKVREEMAALRKDGTKPDPAQSEALIDRMYKLRADQDKAMLRNRLEREKIFTPEQLEKMKQGAGMRIRGLMGGALMREGRVGLRRGAALGQRPLQRIRDRARQLRMRRQALRRIREQ